MWRKSLQHLCLAQGHFLGKVMKSWCWRRDLHTCVPCTRTLFQCVFKNGPHNEFRSWQITNKHCELGKTRLMKDPFLCVGYISYMWKVSKDICRTSCVTASQLCMSCECGKEEDKNLSYGSQALSPRWPCGHLRVSLSKAEELLPPFPSAFPVSVTGTVSTRSHNSGTQESHLSPH